MRLPFSASTPASYRREGRSCEGLQDTRRWSILSAQGRFALPAKAEWPYYSLRSNRTIVLVSGVTPMSSALFPSLVLLGGLLVQHPQSLITSARELGGKADNDLTVELTFVPFDTLVANAVLIVRGRVRSVSTRLSTDERWVLTQYEVRPTQFLKSPSTDKSGSIENQRVFVTHPGGQTRFNGLELATKMNVYREAETLRQGEDVILFLSKKQSEPGTFGLEGGPFGAFRVNDGMVTHMTQAVRDKHPDEPLTALEQRISETLATVKFLDTNADAR